MRKKIVLLMLLFIANGAFAQSDNTQKNSETKDSVRSVVSGVVVDNLTNQPLIGSVVSISGTTNGAIADEQGRFSVKNINVGQEAQLDFSYVGYRNLSVKIKPDKKFYTLDTIRLRSELMIDSILITADVVPVKMKGDTTVFNAAAYKTNPDATAGDLLNKMPGFDEDENGNVTAKGKNITKVYVDGKNFFKNDVKGALETLPAGAVEGIELFDEMSDKSKFTGFDDGNKNQVINIVTKTKSKSAKVIDVLAGYGLNDIYMSNALYSKFEKDGNLSVGVGSNNVNMPIVSSGRHFGRGGGNNTQTGAQMNFSKQFKDNGSISFHYNFSRKNSDIENRSYSTYFETDEYKNRTYDSETISNTLNNSHNFGLDLERDFGKNKKTRITFRPTIRASYGDGTTNSMSNSVIDGESTRLDNITYNKPQNINIGGSFDLMRKFTDNNFLTLSVTGSYSDDKSEGTLKGKTTYNSDNNQSSTVIDDQRSQNYSTGNTLAGNLEYTQRISETSGLSAFYNFSVNNSRGDRKTYDIFYDDNGLFDHEALDSIKSNELNRDRLTNKIGARYNFKLDEFNFNFSTAYQNSQIMDEQLFPKTYVDEHKFNGVEFTANVNYNISETSSLNIDYSGMPSYPSINQLQNTLNNDNPLQLSTGNPNLKQSFNNNLGLSYSWSNYKKGIYFNLFGRGSNVMNSVVNSTILFDEDTTIDINGLSYDVKRGTQLSSYINMDGTWNMFLGSSFSFPFKLIKSKINMGLGYRYSQNPSMFNNQDFQTTSSTYFMRFGISSNISEYIDFNIRNRLSYSVSKSERTRNESNISFTDNLTVGTNIFLWKGLFVNCDYTMGYVHYMNSSNENPFNNMLNAAVGFKFNKNAWEVRMSAFDILDENRSVRQTVNDLSITQTYGNNIGQYFAISLSYKFNSYKKDMKQFMNRSHGGMRIGGHGHR